MVRPGRGLRRVGEAVSTGSTLLKGLVWLGVVAGGPGLLFLAVLVLAPDQPDLLWKAPAGFGLARRTATGVFS